MGGGADVPWWKVAGSTSYGAGAGAGAFGPVRTTWSSALVGLVGPGEAPGPGVGAGREVVADIVPRLAWLEAHGLSDEYVCLAAGAWLGVCVCVVGWVGACVCASLPACGWACVCVAGWVGACVCHAAGA